MIYTVSKKNYLIAVIFISIFFLYGCNEKITTKNDTQIENNKNSNNIITGNNKKIENKSGLNTKSEKEKEKEIDINIQLEEDKLYENKKEGFTLKIGTGRKIKENVNGLLVSIYLPQKQGDKIKENLSINIYLQNGNQTIEEYYVQQKEGIKNHIKDFKEISKEEYKIEKIKGIKIIYKGILGINRLQRQQIIFYKNGKIFLITYTATQDTFNEYLNQTNDIIKSLKF